LPICPRRPRRPARRTRPRTRPDRPLLGDAAAAGQGTGGASRSHRHPLTLEDRRGTVRTGRSRAMTEHDTAPTDRAPALPPVADRATFDARLDQLRIREKAHTREGDALAAQRRRLPMVEVA